MATINGNGKKDEVEKTDLAEAILAKLGQFDNPPKPPKWSIITFSIVVSVFVLVLLFTTFFFIRTMNNMNATYIQKTEQIIIGRENIEMANSWERMPAQQRKEMLRSQYFKIIRYYTEGVPEEQRMNDDLLLETFNSLWLTTERLNQNFFLSLAYMKVATNFNPIYNVEYKRGIGGFYLRTYEQIANLPLVRTDPVFQVVYKGSETVNNPVFAMKLVVARIYDLMTTFNNRADWVLLSMFTNEYDVINKYWANGEGSIPDEFYKTGQLAEALRYYHAFSNWEIPKSRKL